MRELKIGTGWVRGVVGEALNPELAIRFARAFGTWADGGAVVIGRDSRASSIMFQEAVTAGLLASGCPVVDLGPTSTPLVSFALREAGAAGGISITGSHNDSSWNALKLLGPEGSLLSPIKSEEFLDLFHASSFRTFDVAPAAPASADPVLTDSYLDYLCSAIAEEEIRERAFRIALDFRFGATVPVARRFLERLGVRLVALNSAPGPGRGVQLEPTRDSLGELAGAVSRDRFDLGAALNIDGDRLVLVCEDGSCLSEEYTLPLVALSRLRRRPGPVVTTFSTSGRIDRVAAEFGQKVHRTSVGESHVMNRGMELEAVVAGEGSGGVSALPASMTFDALLSLGIVLEELARQRVPLSSLARMIPATAMRKGQIRCPAPAAYRALAACRRFYGSWVTNLDDGIRLDWPDAWLHLRVSNTEPLLRIIAESNDAERTGEIYQGCCDLIQRSMTGGRQS